VTWGERLAEADFLEDPGAVKNRGELKVHVQLGERDAFFPGRLRQCQAAHGQRQGVGVNLRLLDGDLEFGQRGQALVRANFRVHGKES
jgi:hypothetical protein